MATKHDVQISFYDDSHLLIVTRQMEFIPRVGDSLVCPHFKRTYEYCETTVFNVRDVTIFYNDDFSEIDHIRLSVN